MKNSFSDQSFNYIESDEEEDDERVSNEGDDDSDSSSLGNRQQSKPNSYNTAWPQSYRY